MNGTAEVFPKMFKQSTAFGEGKTLRVMMKQARQWMEPLECLQNIWDPWTNLQIKSVCSRKYSIHLTINTVNELPINLRQQADEPVEAYDKT